MTKKCRSCRVDIDEKAKQCPNCRADQRNWFDRHPIITGIFALILLGLTAMVIGGTNSGSSNQMQTYSGAGGGNSFIQEHMGHALQHLGL